MVVDSPLGGSWPWKTLPFSLINEPHIIESNIFKSDINVSLLPHCENHFEDFVVFCCCIFETKYTEFNFINIQK